MKQYQDLGNGNYQIDAVSFGDNHRFADQMLIEIEAGKAEILPYIEPAPSVEDLKLTGVEFEDTMCSATAEDMWGLNSVENWVVSGQTVNFKFQNGNVLLLTSENIDAFKTAWIPFRASFF